MAGAVTSSNSSLVRSGINEAGLWGTGLYGGITALGGEGVTYLSAAGAGMGLAGEAIGPAMVAGSLGQIAYGYRSDGWAYGQNTADAVANNELELTGAYIGTVAGSFAGMPWLGMGIGYGAGALTNMYLDYQASDPFGGATPLVVADNVGGYNFATAFDSGWGGQASVPAFALTGATSLTPFTPDTVTANAFSNLQAPSSVTWGGYSGSPGYESMPAELADVTYPAISYYTPTTVGQGLPQGYVGIDGSSYGAPQPLEQPVQGYVSADFGNYGANAGMLTAYSADGGGMSTPGGEVTIQNYDWLNHLDAATYPYELPGTMSLPGTPGDVTPTIEVTAEGSAARISVTGTYNISTDTAFQALNAVFGGAYEAFDALAGAVSQGLGTIFGGDGGGDGNAGGGDAAGDGEGEGEGEGEGGPVVLDLSGKGIGIDPLSQSNMFFDMANDGYKQHTAWAAAGNGVLVYDPSGGAVTQANQVEFTLWDAAAKSDMQALEDVFDANHDGVLNSSDASWNDFRIMVTNADGTTTLETMAQAGVTSIELTANSYKQEFTDGSSIDGETTFTRSDGTTGTAATVTFAYDGADYNVQQSVTQSGGSTTVTNSAYNPDGTLAQTVSTTTSASGLDKTTVTADGSGIVLQTETDNTVVNGSTTTETLTDYNASNVVLDSTVTTTVATGSTAPNGSPVQTVTIDRDPTSAGYTAQQEVDTTNADGSTSVSVSDLNRDGSLIDKTVSSVSADGLTRTVQVDSTGAVDANGNPIFDLAETDATVINNGVRTETATDKNIDGSMRDQTVTVTSADGLNRTTSIDSAGAVDSSGNAVFNLIETTAIVNNSDGGATTTQTDYANNGAILDQTVTTVSGDGLTTKTQINSTGNNNTFDETITNSTTVDGSGDRTRAITDASADGTVYAEQVIVDNADGKTGSENDYVNYGSGLVLTQSETKTVDGSGNLVDTVTSYASDGTTKTGQTVTTSANGLVTTTETDPSGSGTFEYITTSTMVANTGGGSTATVVEKSANGALIQATQTTKSTDGLTITTLTDTNSAVDGSGNPVYDLETLDSTATSGGTITEIITTSLNGVFQGQRTIVTSADRSTVITTTFDADNKKVQAGTVYTAPNGVTTDTLANYNPDGSLLNETVTTTSSNGLSVTMQTDANGAVDASGNPVFDVTTVDSTTVNSDGNRTETVTQTKGTGTQAVQASQTVTTTSANGLSKTTTVNIDGKVDYTTTDDTVLNADGSRTETVTKENANGAVIGSTVAATSGNGLSITSQIDEDGDGVIDFTRTDVTALNADGSKTETVTDVNGSSANGTVYAERVIVSNPNGVTGLRSDYVNYGSGLVLGQSETKTVDGSGDLVDTVTTYASDGTTKTGQTVTTTSANGLITTTQVDPSGSGTFEYTTTSTTVANSDGSNTVTVAEKSVNGTLIRATKTTKSADGLTITALTDTNSAVDANGNPVYDLTTQDSTATSGGTITEIITTSLNGVFQGQQTIVTSADRSTVITTTFDADNKKVQAGTVYTAPNGVTTDTLANYNPDGSLLNETVTTTSSNGLSVTMQTDANGAVDASGNPVFDVTTVDSTTVNSDGNRTETVTQTKGTGTQAVQASQTVTTTSANGLSKTTTVNIDGKVDYTTTDDTVLNADGSRTETVTKENANGAVIGSTVAATSGNGLSITSQIDEDGDGVIDLTRTDVTALNADGSKTETVTDVNGTSGSLRDKTVTTTNASGTSVTIDRDTTGLGYNNQIETISTASNGSTVDTVSNYANRALINQTVTTTSANGLTKTVQQDLNGDGVFDKRQVVAIADNSDGSTTVTTTDMSGTTTTGSTVVTTAANGLSSTTSMYNGAGTLLNQQTDAKVIKADGSTTETIADYANNGTLIDEAVTTVSSDGKTTTIDGDNNGTLKNGAPVFDQVETVAEQANGSIVQTVNDYDFKRQSDCPDSQNHCRQRSVLDAGIG